MIVSGIPLLYDLSYKILYKTDFLSFLYEKSYNIWRSQAECQLFV